MNNQSWIKNDGGRSKYFTGKARDCAARAMAIALKLDYQQSYIELAAQNEKSRGTRSARNGITKIDFDKVLKQHGWVWCSAPRFVGRKAKCSDLTGVVIERQATHYVAVIDGVPHDTFDSSYKMVYGYWQQSIPTDLGGKS